MALLARHNDLWFNIRYVGDPNLGQRYIPQARGLMGHLRFLLENGGIAVGHKQQILKDGTKIQALQSPGLYLAEIDVRQTVLKEVPFLPLRGFVCRPFANGDYLDPSHREVLVPWNEETSTYFPMYYQEAFGEPYAATYPSGIQAGTIDWRGPGDVILSWDGHAARNWPNFDFWPGTKWIYQSGFAVVEAPDVVLGAGITQLDNGLNIVAVTQSGKNYKFWKRRTDLVDEWAELGNVDLSSYGSSGTPPPYQNWFFNESGTQAQAVVPLLYKASYSTGSSSSTFQQGRFYHVVADISEAGVAGNVAEQPLVSFSGTQESHHSFVEGAFEFWYQSDVYSPDGTQLWYSVFYFQKNDSYSASASRNFSASGSSIVAADYRGDTPVTATVSVSVSSDSAYTPYSINFWRQRRDFYVVNGADSTVGDQNYNYDLTRDSTLSESVSLSISTGESLQLKDWSFTIQDTSSYSSWNTPDRVELWNLAGQTLSGHGTHRVIGYLDLREGAAVLSEHACDLTGEGDFDLTVPSNNTDTRKRTETAKWKALDKSFTQETELHSYYREVDLSQFLWGENERAFCYPQKTETPEGFDGVVSNEFSGDFDDSSSGSISGTMGVFDNLGGEPNSLGAYKALTVGKTTIPYPSHIITGTTDKRGTFFASMKGFQFQAEETPTFGLPKMTWYYPWYVGPTEETLYLNYFTGYTVSTLVNFDGTDFRVYPISII